MRSRRLMGLALALALAVGLPRARAGSAPATVLSIGDGDTLRVLQGDQRITIRLACIDAPEMAQRPWGPQARAELMRRLPPGRPVSLVPHTIDRFGRLVAEVISEGSINLAMVEAGQAFVYRRYLTGCDARAYLEAEARAAGQRTGVWQVPGGITRPWDFRRQRRVQVIPDGTTPDGRRHRCAEIGSHGLAQELLRQGHSHLDGDGDGEACEGMD